VENLVDLHAAGMVHFRRDITSGPKACTEKRLVIAAVKPLCHPKSSAPRLFLEHEGDLKGLSGARFGRICV
jgi:hypothetical protein